MAWLGGDTHRAAGARWRARGRLTPARHCMRGQGASVGCPTQGLQGAHPGRPTLHHSGEHERVCVCVCARVCVRARVRVCACMRVCTRACLCMCACVVTALCGLHLGPSTGVPGLPSTLTATPQQSHLLHFKGMALSLKTRAQRASAASHACKPCSHASHASHAAVQATQPCKP